MFKSDIVGVKDLEIPFTKPRLETETDVEDYLATYKHTLLETVKQGKKVRV